MIKYIGSKRVLLPVIGRVIGSFGDDVMSVADLFSGTSRVGHMLKGLGYRVIANDLMTYAHVLATCYVQADRGGVVDDAVRLIEEFSGLAGRAGFVTETYCERSRFFTPSNGERIDAIRAAIASKGLEPELESVVLTSLMEAADRVDSTVGVQMAYLKSWAPRAHNGLALRMPDVLSRPAAGGCEAYRLEAQEAAGVIEADAAYIDPPYNQHAYLGNYHVWETIARWDEPEVYGVACKRVDCRTRKSDFNSRRRAAEAMGRFLERVRARFLVVSFNDEGYIAREEMERLLSGRGDVYTLAVDHKRYVGAKIGIHNPRGEKVGRVGRLRNTEYIYVVVPSGYAWTSSREFGAVMAVRPGSAPVGMCEGKARG